MDQLRSKLPKYLSHVTAHLFALGLVRAFVVLNHLVNCTFMSENHCGGF